MNGTFYSNPTFPGELNNEELRDNKDSIKINNLGKIITVFTKFEKEFTGTIEGITNNYILISNAENKEYYLIMINNINYISSKEKIDI